MKQLVSIASVASALCCLALLSASPVSAARAGKLRIVVIDDGDDAIDASALLDVLDAYLTGTHTSIILSHQQGWACPHEEQISRAKLLLAETGAVAAVWAELGAEEEGGSRELFLVMHEAVSGATVEFPVEIGDRTGSAMLRVIAAATRMMIDAELPGDLASVSRVATAEPTPEPWPATDAGRQMSLPETPIVPLGPPVSVERAVPRLPHSLRIAYAGEVHPARPRVLHGVLLGGALFLTPSLALSVDAGYLTHGVRRLQDLEYRPNRIPLRGGLLHPLVDRYVRLDVAAFWAVELVWLDVNVPRGGDPIEDLTRVDTGGGLELAVSVPISGILRLRIAAFAQGMAVSHAYERNGSAVVESNYVRFGWQLGFDIATQ